MPGSQHQGVFGIPRSNLAGYERSPGPMTAVSLLDVYSARCWDAQWLCRQILAASS